MSERIAAFLAQGVPTPHLVVDTDVVAARYRSLGAALPGVRLHYAVKANPAPEILRLLVGLGASFDVASPAEIDACLAAGAQPGALTYGNTIKKRADIAHAHRHGVRTFVFDSLEELEKLADEAPGAGVCCRLLLGGGGADWPLGRKFGCEPDMAADLLVLAGKLDLEPLGVAFHVGSQQREPHRWDEPIATAAALFDTCAAAGVDLTLVDLGGGFPAAHRGAAPPIEAYGARITAALDRHFGGRELQVMAEPGRYLVADAGVLRCEVVLVARKSYTDERRWVYLDAGAFNGLTECLQEAIAYPIRTSRDGEPDGPVVLAGPTCDSVDILYERTEYRLPLGLQAGDTVDLLSTGAYTTTYSTVGFNGIPPLRATYL